MAGRVAVVGSMMTDLVTYGDRAPGPGETLEASRFTIGRGGKGANQAVAAARLGAAVTLVGRVGDDDFGRETLRSLEADGIETSRVLATPDVSTGVATIFVAANGENSILIVKGANARLTAEDIEAAAPRLADCDLILLQLEIPLDTVYATIDWAGRNGKRVLLNPAPATASLDVARIATVDWFVPNQTELAILSGRPAATAEQAEAAGRSLLARGMRRIVVTLGSEGALLLTADGTRHIATVPVTAVDTTGAGDAFIGAFACYEASGVPPEAALRKAARYAALSVTRPGTQISYPTRADLEAFERETGPN